MKKLILIITILALTGCTSTKRLKAFKANQNMLISMIGELYCNDEEVGDKTMARYNTRGNFNCPEKEIEEVEVKIEECTYSTEEGGCE